jgi:hypothetical protein
LNDHLSGLFQGKIGTFAKELAENISRISRAFSRIFETSTPKDIMFNLMKTPTRSAVSKKKRSLNCRKKASGEISNEELMKEASDDGEV